MTSAIVVLDQPHGIADGVAAVAQAVATAVLGPCRPKRIETLPLAALTISLGTVNGLTRPGAALVEDACSAPPASRGRRCRCR